MIDRFSQPLRTVIFVVTGLLGAFGVSKRTRFKIGRLLYLIWFKVWNLPTARWRVLPNVLLIGVSKGGTSSLAAYLSKHPDFYPPIYKEPHYFDLNSREDESWYRAYFPLSLFQWWAIRVRKQGFFTGDFTPSYYLLPHGPERCYSVLGEVKIIISLRNPIDRAYSHFRDSCSLGYEVFERFEDALKAEPIRLRGELEKMRNDPDYCSEAVHNFGYKTRGIYIKYIKYWQEIYPDGSMLILNFDDWVKSPRETFDRICDFVGLKTSGSTANEFRPYNVNSHSFQAMDPEVRKYLSDFFQPHNEALYKHLGVDFRWS